MRDRRNTSLSVSSTGSSGSMRSGRPSLSEKLCLSPPPSSPTLPPPVTKDNRRRTRLNRFMLLKLLAGVAVLLLVLRAFLCWPAYEIGSSNEDQLLGNDCTESLPIAPAAVLVPQASGQAKWTVSIPRNASFPLSGKQYADICMRGETLRRTLMQSSRIGRLVDVHRQPVYYTRDWTFLDVDMAERIEAMALSPPSPNDVCNTSLTFVLDTDDASFGKTLLLLWLSYGLAKKEGRAFFVDDSGWPYGKYATYFAPPLDPKCAPPPRHHIVPCPHQANHLLLSAATAPWTFGPLFDREFIQQRRHGAERYERIFNLIRTGYEDLFRLVGDDASYAQSRISDMRSEASAHGGSVVGMHIRRGDLHPLEYQFSRDYLPLQRFAAGARSVFRLLLAGDAGARGTNDGDDFTTAVEYVHSPLLLASDDPDILAAPELLQAASPFTVRRAQERIQLATKATLDRTSPVEPLREPGSAYVKHIDENSGWEGGFFSALFYSLGNAKSSTLEKLTQLPNAVDDAVPEQAMRMRELVGRAYLFDLDVLGQSDGIVCGVSSAACRILGVMMGWEAVRDGRWVNVDDGRPWSWDGRR